MRISYNWLKDYIDLNIDADELGRRYTAAGLELDETVSRGRDFSGVVVGRVLTCEPVEGSDHLHLCSVDIGAAEPLTVFCGAPNVAAGQLICCAKVGAKLPGDFVIGERKMFGRISQGMICSQQELGVSEDHSGIWVLDDAFAGVEAPLGADIADALQLKDDVLIIELTPNRSDCLGMLNCAREAGALTGLPVKEPVIEYAEEGPAASDDITVRIENYDLCSRYVARIVKNVKIGPSPLWMQKYLLAAGMRPINNVVDISNFVMLELNQPLHTFDYDRIKDKTIVVRAACPGETMQTLDGKDRVFRGDEALITDGANGERPVCIAGIMGGMETEVTEETANILIEAACFDPTANRRAARRLGIPSEATQRFEKGIDVANCDTACRRAAQLLVEYCGGVADKGCVDARAPKYAEGFPARIVTLRPGRVNHILGTSFSEAEITDVMQRLGFSVEDGDGCRLVRVPSYRQDIEGEVDLIEEVARLKGFDLIPQTLPVNASQGGRTEEQKLLLKLKNLCVGHGLFENVNYSFISPKECDKLGLAPDHPWRGGLPISNPLSEEQSVMRQSMLPGLLNAAARNFSRRNPDVRFFETGMIFIPDPEQPLERQPREIPTLGLVLAGSAAAGWQDKAEEYSFFHMKAVVEGVCAALGAPELVFERTREAYLHPGRSARIILNGETLGVIGELHPQAVENYQLDGRVIVAELALPVLFRAALAAGNKEHGLPRFPASTRDIAVIGASSVPASDIRQGIVQAGGEFLRSVELFDLYDKAPIPEGQRSLAFSLQFRADDRTLTDAEVDEAFNAIVKALDESFGYKLR